MYASFFRTILYLFLIFVGVELALQIRAELRYGNSLLSSLFRETDSKQGRSIFRQLEGFRTLSENLSIRAGQIQIQANSLGLRSPELPSDKEILVVLGASTVYGAFARTNDQTFPALLQEIISDDEAGSLHVVNAGIPGNDIHAQTRLFRALFSERKVDTAVIYTGFTNMLAKACRNPGRRETGNGLPVVSLPKWALSYDLILKNTVAYRQIPAAQLVKEPVDTSGIEQAFRDALMTLVETLQAQGARRIVLVENVKSFNAAQTSERQQQLGETILYYAKCYSLGEFNSAYDRMNEIQETIAKERPAVTFLKLTRDGQIPAKYFADSIHFSYEGERFVAQELFRFQAAMSEERM